MDRIYPSFVFFVGILAFCRCGNDHDADWNGETGSEHLPRLYGGYEKPIWTNVFYASNLPHMLLYLCVIKTH